MTSNSARMNVGVIGPGRAGSALAAALARAGHHVVAAYAVSDESKGRVEELFPQAVILGDHWQWPILQQIIGLLAQTALLELQVTDSTWSIWKGRTND